MKKEYIQPMMEAYKMETMQVLQTSPGQNNGEGQIGNFTFNASDLSENNMAADDEELF